MKHRALKSVVALLAGFILGAVLSIATDALMEKLGVFSMADFKNTSMGILIIVILYRFMFNAIGCYLTAKLAPNNPMRHVMIIGVVGTVLSVSGTVVMWEKAIPFYNIAIILISFPSAWIGGKIYVRKNKT
jgi:uncharacterized BrkB/YihY/UPF0761 family membrane protein